MTRGSITPDAYHLKAQISRFMRSVRCCSRSSLVPQGQLPSVSQPATGRLRLVLHHLGCSSASGIVASLNSLFHSTTITESKEITPPSGQTCTAGHRSHWPGSGATTSPVSQTTPSSTLSYYIVPSWWTTGWASYLKPTLRYAQGRRGG